MEQVGTRQQQLCSFEPAGEEAEKRAALGINLNI